MSVLFHPSDNNVLDLNPLSPPPPNDPTLSFLQSYLTYRTRPPFRPCPTTPYTQYDSFLFTHLTSQLSQLSSENLLDLVCLFPPVSLTDHLHSILPSVKPLLSRVVRSLHNRLRNDDLYFVADSLHMLASLASASDRTRSAVIEALSTRSQRADAADKAHAWLRDLSNKREGDVLPNGLTQRQMCVGLASQLVDALLSLPQFERVGYVRLHSSDARIEATIARVANVPVALARDALQKFGGADAAVAALLDGWRPQIGKRAEKDERASVTVDSHQVQRRLVRADARRQAEEERDASVQLAELAIETEGAREGAGSSVQRSVHELAQGVAVDDDIPLEGGVSHYLALDDHESLDIDFPPMSYHNGGGGVNKGAASSGAPRDVRQGGRRGGKGGTRNRQHGEQSRSGEGQNETRDGPRADGGSGRGGGRGRGRGRARGRGRGRGANHGRRTRAVKKQGV